MIPVRYRALIAAGLVVGGFLMGWNWQKNRYDARIATMEAEYAQASADALEAALAEQRRRLESMERVSDEGETIIEAVHAADAGADPSVDRLRVELDAVRARATRELSAAATQRATDRQTILVLTELYRSADERARELGKAFEDSRARGLNCQAAYEAMCSR